MLCRRLDSTSSTQAALRTKLMDEELNRSLLPGNISRKALGRRSTLHLWLKRRTGGTSRRLIIIFLVFSCFVYYWIRGPHSTPVGSWNPSQKYIGPPTSEKEWERRARAVKLAFLDAYYSYERIAFPHDELRPISTIPIKLFVYCYST